VDAALGQVSTAVGDWAGGTRIGECLRQFNHAWSRRVLGQGAIVVLVTDGLEREPTPMLEREMARLRRSCRRLLWLNPLLRYEGFEALAAGVRTMLPHVHALCPAHNVESLRGFASALDDARVPAEVRRAGRGVGPSPPRHTSVKGS
jgi:uncharacterized protein with von Willebrand factor type A (vWA) domain